MSVKKNFIYNGILLVSQYIFPMLVFPYITRIFGASTLGMVSFVDGICDYFILFSTLGLTLTGLRAVAKSRDDKEVLSKTFSELLALHLLSTLIFVGIYVVLTMTVPRMRVNSDLFYISISKLVFNVFLIEWFYRGIENFKFITLRSIIVKVLYVALIFLLVKTKADYYIYYILTCSVVVFNAIINFSFVRTKVFFVYKNLNIRQHLMSYFTVGLYMLVTSMYTSFNIGFLGFVSNNTSVGYYSTSSKLFSIIMGFFGALNTVLIPRLSSLTQKDNDDEMMALINKSLGFLVTFCFPIIIVCLVLAKPIIHAISGAGFDGAIICFRLIIPLIFVLGLAQIFANQILMTLKKDRELLIASVTGAVLGVTLNILLVPKFKEVGTSLVLLVSEIIVTVVLYYFTIKYSSFRFPYVSVLKNLLFSIPYFCICYASLMLFSNPFLIIASASVLSGIYFVISQLFLLKNPLLTPYYHNLTSILRKRYAT
jgi:O-antigen/teichoic acid export membrane protein